MTSDTHCSFAASVDYETDQKIQDTIATEFTDKTILCIARKSHVELRFLVLNVRLHRPFANHYIIRQSGEYTVAPRWTVINICTSACPWCRPNCCEWPSSYSSRFSHSKLVLCRNSTPPKTCTTNRMVFSEGCANGLPSHWRISSWQLATSVKSEPQNNLEYIFLFRTTG